MVTIKDVAKKAGVSISTVSRVFNKRGWVNEDTEKKVLLAIKELKYEPSPMARALKEQGTLIIGAFISHPGGSLYEDLFFTEVIRGIGEALDTRGLNLLIFTSAIGKSSNVNFKRMNSQLLEGLIIGGLSINHEKELEKNIEIDTIPIVIIGRHLSNIQTSRVIVDNENGGYSVGRMLLQKGVKHFGIITPPLSFYSFKERFEGLHRAAEEAGQKISKKDIIITPEINETNGYEYTKKLLNENKHLEALVITQTDLTLGAIKYIRESQIKVPDDLMVIGDAPSHMISLNNENICLVHTDAHNLGRSSVMLLLNEIDAKKRALNNIVISREIYVPASWNHYRLSN